MDFEDLQRHWHAFGEEDPLWAILSASGKRGGGWELDEFLATGRADVEGVLGTLSNHGITVERGRALDFGCGVGRLTQALAYHFDRCDGVDLALSMVKHARALNSNPERVYFHHNDAADLRLFSDRSFDFVLALLVLQHMEPSMMRGYLNEFVRVLRPGGVAYFNIPERAQLGERLAPQACRATVALRGAVPALTAGGVGLLELTVRNESPIPWPASALLYLGDRWRSLDGGPVLFEGSRSVIATDLAPGQEHGVQLEVVAPLESGDYTLEVDIVQEFVTWFGDQGSNTLRVPVSVSDRRQHANGELHADAGESDRGRFTPTIEMHTLDQREATKILRAAGATVLETIPTGRCGPSHPSIDYVVTRPRQPRPRWRRFAGRSRLGR